MTVQWKALSQVIIKREELRKCKGKCQVEETRGDGYMYATRSYCCSLWQLRTPYNSIILAYRLLFPAEILFAQKVKDILYIGLYHFPYKFKSWYRLALFLVLNTAWDH